MTAARVVPAPSRPPPRGEAGALAWVRANLFSGPASALATLVVLGLAVVAAAPRSQGRLWELSHWPTWAPVVAGVVLAAGFAHTALRSGLWRWGLYALASIAGGVAFWLFPFGARINPSDRLTLLLFSLGGLLILTGVVVVLQFTRTHPVVAEESGRGA